MQAMKKDIHPKFFEEAKVRSRCLAGSVSCERSLGVSKGGHLAL